MKNASQLLKDHLKYVGSDPSKWLTLFAPNAVIEVPYLIAKEVELKNLQIYPLEGTNGISADYEFNQHKYICYLKAENGKITFLQEREHYVEF